MYLKIWVTQDFCTVLCRRERNKYISYVMKILLLYYYIYYNKEL